MSVFFLTGRSSNNIGCLALKEKNENPNLTIGQICLLHALIYFVYQILFSSFKLFHQLEMCIFLILPVVVLFLSFEVHCVKRVALLFL